MTYQIFLTLIIQHQQNLHNKRKILLVYII